MTLVVLPRRPGAVPVLTGDGVGARVVAEDVRLAAVRAQEASDEADAGALGASWSGPASVRAEHAMTRLARDLDDAVAALWRGVTALDEYAEALVGLELERERLVEQRSLIDVELDELERTVPLMGPDQVVGAQSRANLLGVRVVAHEGEVRRWWGEVVVVEDRAIAALAAVDTAVEAREYAASRSEVVDRVRAGLVASGVLPGETAGMGAEELAVWLTDHPEVAAVLARATPMSGEGPVGELAALASASTSSAGSLMFGGAGAVLAGAAVGGAAGVRERARALFESLPAEDARMLALLYPGVVGSLGGVPFDYRADANRVLVVDALARERAWQEELLDRRETTGSLTSEIEKSEKRIELYESVLEQDRTILHLKPAVAGGSDGAMVELHGTIDEQTRNVAISVPGTGAELSKFDGFSERVESFYLKAQTDDPGSLAMIAWLGGDFPDEVFTDAFSAEYAERLAPGLAAFSHEVRQEIDCSGGTDVRTTIDGHSYGGTVVGLSETHGLAADRVVHVESAGMGKDVFNQGDLPASQAGVDRYALTAPGDPIGYAQATGRHGADPDEFEGITRLHTGYYQDANGNRLGVIVGGTAHSGVYEPDSESWWQLYELYTGGIVETYRTPQYLPTSAAKAFLGGLPGHFVASSEVIGFANDGHQVDIP